MEKMESIVVQRYINRIALAVKALIPPQAIDWPLVQRCTMV